jgi:hypothetical protein
LPASGDLHEHDDGPQFGGPEDVAEAVAFPIGNGFVNGEKTLRLTLAWRPALH